MPNNFMKVLPKEYAIGLIESIKGKNDNEIKKITDNFVDLLIKNNDLSKSENISRIFSSLWNKENKIVESEIITAKKIDGDSLASLKNFLTNKTGAKKITINERIDKNIIGGTIIKYNDKVLDKSLKTKIKKLSDSIKS